MYYEMKIDFLPEEVLDYLRKSRSDDPLKSVEEVLENHESILDEWAEKNLGGKVPEENKYREVVSGETLKERPEIQRLLKRIESPKIKAVKVVEPQRLTRGDLEDVGRLMKLLKHTNTLVITPNRIYNLRDEYDWDAFERELKRGNEFLEYTKKILNRGRLLSVSQGNYLGSMPPYGYTKTKVLEGRKKCPTLIENKEEANVVRMIFDMYVNQDLGRNTICRKLDELGVKPPRGKHWSPETLQDMIANVHYIGKVKWNWRKTITIVEDSEIIQTRPKAKVGEFLIYDGKHEAIIPEDIFNAAREKQGRRHRVKSDAKLRNPFAGLLFCKCGRAIVMQTYQKSGTLAMRLACHGQVHCQTGSCSYEEILDRVCEALKQCIEDFEVRIQNNEGDSVKLHTSLIKNLEKKKKALEKQELSQWEAQSHPDESQRMPPHIFKMLNERLLKEKEEVQAALCKAYESMPEPINYEEKIVTFKEALDALHDPEVEAAKKNILLKACIERIEYSRKKPERMKRGVKRSRKGAVLQKGANWTNPPVELDIKLKV